MNETAAERLARLKDELRHAWSNADEDEIERLNFDIEQEVAEAAAEKVDGELGSAR
jgi:hypothetical protein